MTTATREIERLAQQAGFSSEEATMIADRVQDGLSDLATKDDIASINRRIDDLKEALKALDDRMWKVAWIGFGMWSTTFGALMYAVFGT